MLRGGISCLGNLSLLSTCMQIPLIVTQRLHIFDIDRQLTIFRFTQRSPIIAYVNMYANRFYRHTTFPYCRHRQATNHVQRHTTFSYYRSCEHYYYYYYYYLSKSRSYKMNKYANYNHHLNSQFKMHRIKLFTVEVSVLGFISLTWLNFVLFRVFQSFRRISK